MASKVIDIKQLKARENIARWMKAFSLIKQSDVLGYLDDAQLIKIIMFCDSKGWMHYKYENGKMVFVGCGYNIPKFDAKTCHILPVKSEGDVLFVPFIVSKALDKTLPQQAISEYIKENPNTRTVVYYKDDAKEPTIFNRKGEAHGKE